MFVRDTKACTRNVCWSYEIKGCTRNVCWSYEIKCLYVIGKVVLEKLASKNKNKTKASKII